MKAGDKFRLDAKWWRDNKPKTLLKSTELGDALDEFSRTEVAFNQAVASGQRYSDKPYKAFKAVWDALARVDRCRVGAIQSAGILHRETAAALREAQVIPARQKLLRELMAKAIATDVKALVELQNDLDATVKEMAKRQQLAEKNYLPRAEKGDEAALKSFKTSVGSITVGVQSKVDTDQVKGRADLIAQWITTLPGDFSGHSRSVRGVRDAALKLNSDARKLIDWTRKYKDYDPEN